MDEQQTEQPDYTQTPFAFYDLATGAVLTRGHVPAQWLDLQVPPEGQGRYDGEATPGLHAIIDGQCVERVITPAEQAVAKALSVRQARAVAYPPVTDQLDVIWRLIAHLPTDQLTPEAAEMLGQIKQIKADHPKEVEA